VSHGVKRFITSAIDTDEDPDEELLSMSLFSPADFTVCEDVIRQLCPLEEKADLWISKVKLGHWDPVAGLTLALLPNLEYLEMESYPSCLDTDANDKFMCYVLNRAARLQEEGQFDHRGALSKLRSVRLAYDQYSDGFSFADILAFMRPRSLKKIFIHLLGDDNFQPLGQTFFAEKLTLQYSWVEGDCLIRFLSSFPNLRYLSYENAGASVGDYITDFFPRKLWQAVAHLKHSLEVLKVKDLDGNLYGDEERLPFGSFAGFEKLRELDTHSEHLFGKPDATAVHEHGNDELRKGWSLVNVVPTSLRGLVLTDCQGNEFSELRQLLRVRKEVAPLLEYVTFTYRQRRVGQEWFSSMPGNEEIKVLQTECDMAGIRFQAI
jgi:hypothetical protein